MNNRTFALFAIVFLTIACSRPGASDRPAGAALTKGAPFDAFKQSEMSSDTQLFSQSAPRGYTVISYDLQAEFDWELDVLNGRVTIELDRQIDIESIELDSHVDRVMSVTLDSKGPVPFAVDTAKGTINVSLPKSYSSKRLKLQVDYRAKGGSQADPRRANLVAIRPRRGDPVRSRVLYTHSEPRAASAWMPCNDRPNNRARFAVQFTLPVAERLISNGRLIRDEVVDGRRIMAYKTDLPIPTYIMAFAQGEFVVASRQHGALPISIWARRGVHADLEGLLDETDRQLTTFENLLVPYPFEKYAVVLLPDFGGGMEHASITFNEELSSSQRLMDDLSLMAHELGHQWFGDLVTVRSWDDLWIKEGMATLLASESARVYEDEKNSGILMGNSFKIVSGQAMRDPQLPPESKYNSGPYGRSAWYLTQLRALVGEPAFWGTLRTILATHAYGTISSEEFLEAFRPLLGDELHEKALKALDAHELPRIQGTWENNTLHMTLTDPEEVLLADLELDETSVDGRLQRSTVEPGKSVVLTRTTGLLTVFDPRDIHPLFQSWIRGENASAEQLAVDTAMKALSVPQNHEELEVFKNLSPSAQWLALDSKANWKLDAAEFSNLTEGLTSASARFASLAVACKEAKSATEGEKQAWKDSLEGPLTNPPILGISMSSPSLADCEGFLPTLLDEKLSLLARQPSSARFSDVELFYLVRLPAKEDFKVWAPLAKNAPTLRSRFLALLRLAGGSKPDLPDAPGLKALFLDQLANSDISLMRIGAILGIKQINDTEAFGPLADVVLNSKSSPFVAPFATCAAWYISKSKAGLWDEFLSRLGKRTDLLPVVQQVIENPEQECPKWWRL